MADRSSMPVVTEAHGFCARAALLSGPLVIALNIRGDSRWWFQDTHRSGVFQQFRAWDAFMQPSHSRPARGVLRSLHI